MITATILLILLAVFLIADLLRKESDKKDTTYRPLETGEALDIIHVKLRGNVIPFAEWQNYIKQQIKNK